MKLLKAPNKHALYIGVKKIKKTKLNEQIGFNKKTEKNKWIG